MKMPVTIRRASGFSLIEILIAVVVLATGLLALTALQGRLAQASAEAKVRGRVAAVLTSRMDEIRALQYDSIPPAGTATTSNTVTCAAGNWVCTAQEESGVAGLAVAESYARFRHVGGTFVADSAGTSASPAEFKRITLNATWTDATGVGRNLGMSTDVSLLSLTANQIPNAPGGAGAGGRAVVRQDNPAGPGVIPIAIGGGEATAASNPRPEVIGRKNNESIVGTRFDVLTYQGLSGPARIQRRVETAVIGCRCQYGAGGTNLGEIYRSAQWPAQWTGEKYEVVVPSGNPDAPGKALSSGPVANVEQSPLCTECCRDHHDAAANTEKFDPLRTGTGAYPHYLNLTTAVSPESPNQYMEACRLIRVDGFWRTATDMYAKHIGLVKTAAVDGQEAKSGAPDATAVTAYETFVKTHLAKYPGSPPGVANEVDGGLVSGKININAPPTQDERYLHARGLYVDFLGTKALERIASARAAANCPGGNLDECMLPYLPFTTINLTELAFWEPKKDGQPNSTILAVATGSSLVYDPLQPTRGRTNAKAGAPNGETADAVALIGRSNSGVAIEDAVDPDDASATGSDKQEFLIVGGSSTTPGEPFTVRLEGPSNGQSAMAFYDNNTSNDPSVAWSNGTGNANCNGSFANNGDKDPNDYLCDTYGSLGLATEIRVANYFREYEVRTNNYSATCGGQTLTDTVDVPTFANYVVSSATVGGVSATSIVATNDGKTSEYTVASFGSVPASARVDLIFTLTSAVPATVASCAVGNGNKITNIVWTRPWQVP